MISWYLYRKTIQDVLLIDQWGYVDDRLILHHIKCTYYLILFVESHPQYIDNIQYIVICLYVCTMYIADSATLMYIVHVCTYVYMYVHIHTCMFCFCVYVCMYACV